MKGTITRAPMICFAIIGVFLALIIGEEIRVYPQDSEDAGPAVSANGRATPLLRSAAEQYARALQHGDVDALTTIVAAEDVTAHDRQADRALAQDLVRRYGGRPARLVRAGHGAEEDAVWIRIEATCPSGRTVRFFVGADWHEGSFWRRGRYDLSSPGPISDYPACT